MKIRLARKIDKWVFAVEGCNFRMQSLDESTGEICQGERCRHCYYGKIYRRRNYSEAQVEKAKYKLGKIWYNKIICTQMKKLHKNVMCYALTLNL